MKPAPPVATPWFTPREAATYIRTSDRWIYHLIETGKLKAHRPSPRIVRIHVDDLNAVLRYVGALPGDGAAVLTGLI